MRFAALSLALCACLPRSTLHPIGAEHNARCAALIHAGDLPQARAECLLAWQYNPDAAPVLVNLGLIEYREGAPEKARDWWIRAARADNENAQAYNNLGVLALDDRDFRGAESRFERALQVDPAYLEARKGLSLAQRRLDKLDAAELTLRQMIAVAPLLSEPYHDLGTLRLQRGDAAGAAKWFEQAVQIEAGYAQAWKGLAVAREQLGLAQAAAEAFGSCVDADPGDAECASGLTRTNRAAATK